MRRHLVCSSMQDIVKEVQDLADQRAIDFYKQKSIELTAARMKRYGEESSLLEFFVSTRRRYNQLVDQLATCDHSEYNVEEIYKDIQGRLDEAQAHWDSLYLEPVAVRRTGGSRNGEQLFKNIHPSTVLGGSSNDTPKDEANKVTEALLSFARSNIPFQENRSIHGIRAYRSQQHLDDLVHSACREEDSMNLEETENLIHENMARILVALETVAEYEQRLQAAE